MSTVDLLTSMRALALSRSLVAYRIVTRLTPIVCQLLHMSRCVAIMTCCEQTLKLMPSCLNLTVVVVKQEVALIFVAIFMLLVMISRLSLISTSQPIAPAYAIASACHMIIMPETAGAGSVGVIAGRMDQTEQYKSVGVKFDLITSGEFKGDLHPLKPYTEAEKKRIQKEVDALAIEFYDMVAEHRDSTPQAIKSLEAGTFTGEAAIAAGLVDAIMSQDEFYQYLTTAEINDMFNFSKKDADGTVTQAEHKQALDAQKSDLIKQAESAFSQQLEASKKDWAKAELTRQQAIFETAKEVGKPEAALELIVSGASAADAKNKLFQAASDVDNIFTATAEQTTETPDGDNGNAMLAAVKAIADQQSVNMT